MDKINKQKQTDLIDNLEGGVVADPEKLQAVIEDYGEVIDNNADESIKIHTSDTEPPNPDAKTYWFDSSENLDFSGGGVAIANAETSTTPPETHFWFQPV